jgi:hypothetical protein
MKRALEITGSYKGVTGHDHHTRSIVRALHQAGVEIKLNDLPEWSPAKLPLSLQDEFFKRFDRHVDAFVHLFFCMPHQVVPGAGRIINYTMFEADRIPEDWVDLSRHHDLIVVPVESCRQAWTDSGVPKGKVAVAPLGVDVSLFAPGIEPLPLSDPRGRTASQYSVRFLNISHAVERKNLFGLLRMWLIATNANDDAALLLKPGFYSQDSRSSFLMRLHQLERSVGKALKDAAPVFWLGGTFTPESMPSLYAAATHYISVSRGEGFDLPMVEAGVSGLELIAPRHSAYLDYLSDEIAHLINARPVEAKVPDDDDTGKLLKGAHWWEPEQDEVCAALRAIIDGKSKRKASPRDSLMRLTWSRTAELLERICFQ